MPPFLNGSNPIDLPAIVTRHHIVFQKDHDIAAHDLMQMEENAILVPSDAAVRPSDMWDFARPE